MLHEKIIEYLQKNNTQKDYEAMLGQFKDINNNLFIELLMHLKSNNFDKMEQVLADGHQFRIIVTDILDKLDERDQFLYQLCKYISTWNLFNKILEIESKWFHNKVYMWRNNLRNKQTYQNIFHFIFQGGTSE